MAAANTGVVVAAYGFDGGDRRTTRIYDIRANSWSFGSPGPSPARSEAVAVRRGSFLYSIGGRADDVIADLDRYDAFTDTWKSLADMPTPRAGIAAVRSGTAIYAIGGRSSPSGPCSGPAIGTVERYDIRSDTWASVAPLPTRRSDAAAAVVNGKIYVFGGCQGDSFLRTVDVYNPATNTWSKAPENLPQPRAGMYQIAALGEAGPAPKVYIIGGWDGTGIGESSVFIYRVMTDSYTRGTNMPTARAEMGVADFRGEIYTVGGAQPAFGASVDAVEVYSP